MSRQEKCECALHRIKKCLYEVSSCVLTAINCDDIIFLQKITKTMIYFIVYSIEHKLGAFDDIIHKYRTDYLMIEPFLSYALFAHCTCSIAVVT